MPRARKAGVDTYWTTYGQGARPALMIHATLAHSGSWGEMARHLSGMLTMTAFDLPGHGRSADWEASGEIQATAADIAADFLDGPTDIIGHSFGATVALRLAVERPGMVRSLALIEPVFFAVACADHPETAGDVLAEEAALGAALAAGECDRAARDFTAKWDDGPSWAEMAEDRKARLARQMPIVQASAAALYHDAGGMLRPGVLQGVNAPALLIEGSASPPVIGAICEGLAARLPRAERAMIVGAGHMAPVSHARQVAAELLRLYSLV